MKRLLASLIPLALAYLCQSQVVRVGRLVYPSGIAPNLIVVSTNTLSGFSTPQGTAGTAQTFTVSASGLVAGVIVTAPTKYEVSTDNSTFLGSFTLGQSAGILVGQPVTIYVRLTSLATAGTANGTVTLASTGAATKAITLSGTVTSTSPSLSPSTNSLSTFSNVAGSASASQSFTLTGANLTANALVAAPTGFEVSLDNSSFASSRSVTQSGGTLTGQPITIYARIAAATAAGSYSGSILISSVGASNVNVAVNGTVSSSGGGNVAKFNITYSPQAVAGWTNISGDPRLGQSVTDASTGWTLNTVGANWGAFFGTLWGTNDKGAVSGTFTSTFPQPAMAGMYFNITIYFTGSNYGFQVPNLPAGNYTVRLVGSIQSSYNNVIDFPWYHVKFGSTADQVNHSMNCQDNTGTGTNGFLSFTGNINTGEMLQISANQDDNNLPGAAVINAITITKN